MSFERITRVDEIIPPSVRRRILRDAYGNTDPVSFFPYWKNWREGNRTLEGREERTRPEKTLQKEQSFEAMPKDGRFLSPLNQGRCKCESCALRKGKEDAKLNYYKNQFSIPNINCVCSLLLDLISSETCTVY